MNILLLLLLSLLIILFIYDKQKENNKLKKVYIKSGIPDLESGTQDIESGTCNIKSSISDIESGTPDIESKTCNCYNKSNKHHNTFENEDTTSDSELADINDEYILPTVHNNIITPYEAKYIIESSADYFKDSVTVGGINEGVRKSKTAWHNKNNPIIKNIIMRICKMTNTPYENAEHLQVVKYDINGYYNEHYDTVTDNSEISKDFLRLGGHRIITMVIYLNDGFEEGATKFINLNQTIKPPKYSGILFYTFDKNLKKCHPKSLHAGLPIKSGNKYIANVWFRENEFPNSNNTNGLVPYN